MAGGTLHHISSDVLQSWPEPNPNAVHRQWFPPYAITLQGITTALLLARLWSRFRRYSGRLGVDDLLILIGWAFATALTVISSLATIEYGFDRHAWEIDSERLDTAAFILWFTGILFLIGGALVKCSILVFYRRIIGPSYGTVWGWACWAAVFFTVTYTFALVITAFVICTPFGSYWQSFTPNYDMDQTHCMDERAFWVIGGVLGVISDVYALVVPGFLLWKLQMTRGQRVGLIGISLLAFSAVGASIARSVYLRQFVDFNRSDITWLQFPIFVTSQFELQVAIMCACAPSLKAFLCEAITTPLQEAYRCSKHLSASFTSMYTDGTRFRHRRNNSSVHSTSRATTAQDLYKQKLPFPLQGDSTKSPLSTTRSRKSGSFGSTIASIEHVTHNISQPQLSETFPVLTPTASRKMSVGDNKPVAGTVVDPNSFMPLPLPPVPSISRDSVNGPIRSASPLLPPLNRNVVPVLREGPQRTPNSVDPIYRLQERQLARPSTADELRAPERTRERRYQSPNRPRTAGSTARERIWDATLEPTGWNQGFLPDKTFDPYGGQLDLSPPKLPQTWTRRPDSRDSHFADFGSAV